MSRETERFYRQVRLDSPWGVLSGRVGLAGLERLVFGEPPDHPDAGRVAADGRQDEPGHDDEVQARDWLAAYAQSACAGPVAGSWRVGLERLGTPFQCAVWRAIIAIPCGATRTYQHLADTLDRPTAVRAVANACGANPLALLIPCHRVVASDGGLGGYRWRAQRKAALLAHEARVIVHPVQLSVDVSR